MVDFVINSGDLATLRSAAQSSGFWSGDAIATQGRIPGDNDPNASYFLNIVGEVADAPGVWARLRINGLNPFTSGILTIPPTLTVYSLMTPTDGSPPFWTSDGVTPAPAYVANIGVIA